MATKYLARLAAVAATIGIAALPLTMSLPASATTKPEPSGVVGPVVPAGDGERNLDLAQLGAGALGGIALGGAGLAAAARLRRHKLFSDPASTQARTAR